MAEDFKAGDVVQLKSGGPNMTVDWVEDQDGTMAAYCSWFSGNKKEGATFPVTSLKHAAV